MENINGHFNRLFHDRSNYYHLEFTAVYGHNPDRSKLQSSLPSPTLLLRSLNVFAAMEGEKGDSTENSIHAIHRMAGRNLDPTLVSCWLLEKSFTTFSNTVAVIESTVGEISQIITWVSETLHDSYLEHGKIHYYEIGCHDEALNRLLLPHGKAKPKKYASEMEYRFLLKYKHPNMHIRLDELKISLSRHTNHRYIKHIHLSQNIEKEFSCDNLMVLKEIANANRAKWGITSDNPNNLITATIG